MFARVFALLPLALLASASHLEARDTCSTSNQYCCQSTETFGQLSQVFPKLSTIVGNLDVNAVVGLVCSPLVDVAGGSGCTAQTVCCDHNDFNGLITAGCNNIDA